MKNILVTGGAGFIGSNLVEQLLKSNANHVTVLDNFDDFYSTRFKKANIQLALSNPNYRFIEADITDWHALNSLLKKSEVDVIIHLAAKAGVRPSIHNPVDYYRVNVAGTQNLLELANLQRIKQFIFASSSSVYGINESMPWQESDGLLKPISPYASSKLAGEQLGHVYSHLYDFQFIALRFFTVYGPRQRPDLVIHKIIYSILYDLPIPIYGDGTARRDYTFVGDIVQGVIKAMDYRLSPFEIINLGNNQTISLSDLIGKIEHILQKPAIINRLPASAGDVPITCADTQKAQQLLGYHPETDLMTGLRAQVEWHIISTSSYCSE
jgi:UDP-glucuronate 4-epimerase